MGARALDRRGLSSNRLPVPKLSKQPCALIIAGSDSGGGAGVQIDLKVLASLGVHGTSAITCVTAQNPKQVTAIQACKADIVRAQIDAVFEGFSPKAVKTGMLYSASVIRAVAEFFRSRRKPPLLIVDPVMVATSGARLLRPSAQRALTVELLPLASLVTPNLSEAEILTGDKIVEVEELRAAARKIHSQFGCAALVKGGHLRGLDDAVDFYFDGDTELLLKAPFVKGVSTHGTGCSYSAAIAGYVALGCELGYAVEMAKQHITQSIAQSVLVGRHSVLNSFWED
jgi:hydroxymethylpyrimidine/phosphomethylpyrimidine kinase